jgi:Prokaryotic phospholipase A2
MTRRILLILALALAALIPAGAASAATPTDKLAVLSTWTQPTAASTAAWNAARTNQGAWSAYNFDWSTDYCSDSPDNPLGFAFSTSCWHHDFGYRNYKAVGQFPANKDRIDSMFYADLKRVCATYSTVLQPACYSLAWTYYEAVHVFGSIAKVNQADIDKAARIKSQSLAAARS